VHFSNEFFYCEFAGEKLPCSILVTFIKENQMQKAQLVINRKLKKAEFLFENVDSDFSIEI
jgi:hypothetical protein